jgi:hypothetical protein
MRTAHCNRVHRPSVSRLAPRIVLPLFLLSAAVLATSSAKADITYSLQNYPADQDGHTLSGTITTDGHIGPLSSSDIKSWTVTIDSTTFASTDPQASVEIPDTKAVLASSTAITIAFDPVGAPNFNYFSLSSEPDGTMATLSSLSYERDDTERTYAAFLNNGPFLWLTDDPHMGGTDPWVIAAVVPEPSTAIVAAFGAVAFLAYGWFRHRRAERWQAAV